MNALRLAPRQSIENAAYQEGKKNGIQVIFGNKKVTHWSNAGQKLTWSRRDQGCGVEGVIDDEYGAVYTRGLLVGMS